MKAVALFVSRRRGPVFWLARGFGAGFAGAVPWPGGLPMGLELEPLAPVPWPGALFRALPWELVPGAAAGARLELAGVLLEMMKGTLFSSSTRLWPRDMATPYGRSRERSKWPMKSL